MSKKNQNKKNNILKNVGIVMKAWVKRYPSAWILLPLYLGFRIAAPFFETLASSKVVSTITQGDVKNFLITIACLLFLISIIISHYYYFTHVCIWNNFNVIDTFFCQYPYDNFYGIKYDKRGIKLCTLICSLFDCLNSAY